MQRTRIIIRTLSLVVLLAFFSFVVLSQDVERLDMGMLTCGDIVENDFTNNYETHVYTISLDAGSSLDVLGVALGDSLRFRFFMRDAVNNAIAWSNASNTSSASYLITERRPNLVTGVLSATSVYTIAVANADWEGRPTTARGIGVYTLYVNCTLRDGTEIEAGVNLPEPEPTSLAPEPFPGFGFPPVDAVSFEDGIELPLTLGQPAQAPIGGGLVALYTIDASVGQSNTLSVSRLADDFPVGVAVINQANNDIIFFGGMPSSNDLSVTLTFPEAGTYAIGLFALDGTSSGAVQITLE
ncbi:MAG: hypothetical protein AAFV93_17155 [Chloroflexota bacterium]